MKAFNHTNAKTLAEAKTALAGGKANHHCRRHRSHRSHSRTISFPPTPTTLINIKTIAPVSITSRKKPASSKSAPPRASRISPPTRPSTRNTRPWPRRLSRVATPHVRDMGTIGGNIAQLHRCWYFRKPENRFPCVRKGGHHLLCHDGRQPLSLDLRQRQQVHRGPSQRYRSRSHRLECHGRHQHAQNQGGEFL